MTRLPGTAHRVCARCSPISSKGEGEGEDEDGKAVHQAVSKLVMLAPLQSARGAAIRRYEIGACIRVRGGVPCGRPPATVHTKGRVEAHAHVRRSEYRCVDLRRRGEGMGLYGEACFSGVRGLGV